MFIVVNTAWDRPIRNTKGRILSWKTRRGAEKRLQKMLEAYPFLASSYVVKET